MKNRIKSWGYLFCILISCRAFADESPKASFDCKKAKQEVELRICESSAMADLDRLLGEVFQRNLKIAKDPKSLKERQKQWIKGRNDCVGMLPADEESCLISAYVDQIKKLSGVEDLRTLYQAQCKKDQWACMPLGDLDMELGRWEEAVNDLSPLCKADHDGDGGESCFKKASALERLGKKSEALGLMKKTCEGRNHNGACAGAYRLGGKKSSHPWAGLYRSSEGTLFVNVKDEKSGKILLSADTRWANGHQCAWSVTGVAKANALTVEKDSENPECVPVITKSGSTIKVEDPESHCKEAYCGARALYEGDFTFDQKSNP